MLVYYAQRALEILQEEGPINLLKSIHRFSKHQINKKKSGIFMSLRHFKYGLKYDSPLPNHKELIYVNPNNIDYALMSPKVSEPGVFIIGGEWDKSKSDNEVNTIPCYSNKPRFKKLRRKNPWELYRFDKWDHYTSYVNHFNNGVPWNETEFFERLNTQPENNSPKYSPPNRIIDRLRYDEKLYKSMKTNGYLTQREIDNGKNNDENNNDELAVGVTRTGEIIYVLGDAAHRLTIAKILGLESIPAKIKLRHKQWQEFRDEIHNSGFPEGHEELRDHPDLQDVIDD